MFGAELIDAFREFKSIWDPDWRMNPGKIVSGTLVCATPRRCAEEIHGAGGRDRHAESGRPGTSEPGLCSAASQLMRRYRLKKTIGQKRWAIAEGYIPETSHGPEPEMTSHATACLLNASDHDAHVQITIFFSDKDPIGPYRVTVPANRTRHLRFNDLIDPEPIPRGSDYASVIESNVPIVVQHTRLDSRQNASALLTTIAYSTPE